MQHISVLKFSRWLKTDQFFLSILLFKIYLVILSGAYLLLSGAADSQNHWKTAERGQSYIKERGANLVVSFVFIAIAFFETIILWNWVGRSHRDGVKNPKGSKYLQLRKQSSRCNLYWKFKFQDAICTGSSADPLVVTALKSNSRGHLH